MVTLPCPFHNPNTELLVLRARQLEGRLEDIEKAVEA